MKSDRDIGHCGALRPQTFDRFVGQAHLHVLEENCLRSSKENRVSMILGGAGCGKTTLARLIAAIAAWRPIF